ncbi:MAG: YkgJ family cysteine cluster protein [Fuerstiella sp.]
MNELPIIESCDGCGACCRQTPLPPFQPGEEVQRAVPELFLKPVQDRQRAGQQFELIPCVWFDQVTQLCQHYEYRPSACRNFQISSFECHAARNAELYP